MAGLDQHFWPPLTPDKRCTVNHDALYLFCPTLRVEKINVYDDVANFYNSTLEHYFKAKE